MNVLQMPRMIFSFSEGWDDLIRIHPSIARLFAWVVLPLSYCCVFQPIVDGVSG